jgi:hypothetical protein
MLLFGHVLDGLHLVEELLVLAFHLREVVLDLSASSGIGRIVEVWSGLDAARIGSSRWGRWSSGRTGSLSRRSGGLHFARLSVIVIVIVESRLGIGRRGALLPALPEIGWESLQ